ncbi:two-component sensor histidine kinase [Capnocytophaga cynodegmi]|uniref:sensor histidine kinase n=1 Tax=Capnocytophaga cynodegmi TaxID=28189 RepID=UPI001AC89E43|nr:HAMP domain-containing sensor histidine kinase [Capnocytophaga cynodegmi]GIM51623.1 two-component sensor histidine kinase [Capnocytophaga cynodegmi]
MKGKLSTIVIVLMSISLLGIIIIQGYWIKSAVDDREEAFMHSVQQVLNSVINDLEQTEISKYVAQIVDLKEKDTTLVLKESSLREFMYVQENKKTKETFIYKHGVLEEDYSLPTGSGIADSLSIKNYISKQSEQKITFGKDIDNQVTPSVETYEKLSRLPEIERLMIQESFKNIIEKLPIIDRVSPQQISYLVNREMKNRGLDIDFEFAIYNRNILTNIRSKYFDPNEMNEYRAPLFTDSSGDLMYELALIFPQRERFVFSSVIGIASLSVVFMIVIIGVFTITLNQMVTHRRISQIKTDFINNITHEFKTPIATTSLVLDAIKNPVTISNPDKILTYVNMLKDENKRMHSQVENILQISRLEKGELNIEKEPLDVHILIEMAIGHVQMMLNERNGVIRTHLMAENADISANESHFTNVLINVIENAIKYSPEAPEIDIYTENIKNNKILIRVKDQGQGMSKQAVRQVFHKFYREHTGDLHNVKGHGLGLAYVKSIVEDHNGTIYVESEKGKGSTFFIQLSVI